MSFRPGVDRIRMEEFLRELGRVFRHPARIYLVGGTTLVYEGLRGATLDVDFTLAASTQRLQDRAMTSPPGYATPSPRRGEGVA